MKEKNSVSNSVINHSRISLFASSLSLTHATCSIPMLTVSFRPDLQGMELYPRIGKNFDIKVFTNCRFGMMSWAVLAVTYCIKQVFSR